MHGLVIQHSLGPAEGWSPQVGRGVEAFRMFRELLGGVSSEDHSHLRQEGGQVRLVAGEGGRIKHKRAHTEGF